MHVQWDPISPGPGNHYSTPFLGTLCIMESNPALAQETSAVLVSWAWADWIPIVVYMYI